MSPRFYELLWPVLLSVFAALAGGVGLRRLLSSSSAQVAQDGANAKRAEAESGYFGTQVAELTLDRNNWRKSAEDGWREIGRLTTRVAVLEMELRHERDDKKLQLRLARLYPEIARHVFEKSGPAALDALPAPSTSEDPPG